MDRNMACKKSPYVSLIKIKGKPIIPPLMTLEREAEMRHYKHLAMAVETRLKTWCGKKCNNMKNIETEMALLSSSEHVSNNNLFANFGHGNNNSDEIHLELRLEDGTSTINSAGSKKLISCNEVDQSNLRSMTNANLSVGLGRIVKNSLFIEGSQQGETQSNYDGRKDSNKNVIIADTELQCSCLRHKDLKFPYIHQEVMRDNTKTCDKHEFRSDNFNLPPTEYKPWEKIQGDCKEAHIEKLNRKSNQLKSVDVQVITGSDLNKNVVQSTQQRFDKDKYCLLDNLTVPTTETIILKSQLLFSPVDQGHNYTSDNQLLEPSSYRTVNHQGECHSENLYEHDGTEGNGTFAYYSHKAEKPQEISEKSKEVYVRTPLKICEGIVDISKSYFSEISGSEGSVKFNNLESNKNNADDKNKYSIHISPGSLEFSRLGDVNSSTPQENLEDSVSSMAMTSSTDLNQYMNTTGSSGTASPGHNTPSIVQDLLHSSINSSVPPKSSVQESNNKPDMNFSGCNETELILQHNPKILRVEEQKNSHSFDKNIPITDSKKHDTITEKVCEHNSSFGLEDILSEKYHDSSGNKSEGDIKMSRNFCYDKQKCLCDPKKNFHLSHSNVGDTALLNESNCVPTKHNNSEGDSGYNAPPRLVRQNSYTLETPSPLLIAHMETQKGRSKTFVADMTKNALVSPKPCRKAWDLTRAKINWELGNRKIISGNEKPKSSKKSLTSSFRQCSSTGQLQNSNSSLPASKTTSPIKLQTPYASADCLPSAVFKESTNTNRQPSTPRKFSKISIYSPRTKEPRCRSYSASPCKTNKNPPVDKLEILSTLSKSNTGDVGARVPLTSQQDLQGLIINMQSQHSKRMAELLAKQRKEQEDMRKAFVQQQNELLEEIRKIYSTACPPVKCQKALNRSVDNLSSNDSKSVKSSTNNLPLVLYTTNLSLSNSDTSHINRRKSYESSDTILMSHLDSSVSLGIEQNITNLSPKSHKTSVSNDTTGLKEKFMNELAEVVRMELLQQSRGVSKQKCNSKYSLHGSESMVLQSEVFHDVISKFIGLVTQETQGPSPLKLQSPEAVDPSIADVPVEPVRSEKQNANETQIDNLLHPVTNSSLSSGQVKVGENEPGTSKRELFPNSHEGDINHLSQLRHSELEKAAATKITAAAKGFLTRRLFRTARVQDLILTIRDTLLCAMQLNQECWPDITVEDVALHRRLIQQVTAACYALHEVFFTLSTTEQMAIISADREKLRNTTPRPPLPRPLSAATRRAIERKSIQCKSMHLPRRRPVSADCSFQRIKTLMEKDAYYSDLEIIPSYAMKQHQQQQGPPKNRHSPNISSGRRPWR